MADVKIVDVRRLPSVDPQRAGKYDRHVIYQTDAGRVGVVRMPDETFSEQALVERLKKDLAEHAALIGKTLKV